MTTTFGWDLCTLCNYRCPYCEIGHYQDKTPLLTADQWGGVWDRLFQRHGTCHIFVSGGEPSAHPQFVELMKKLVQKHTIEICTNLSWDVDRLVPAISPGKMKIAPTFHPTFADFEDFLKKAIKVKDYLPNSQIYYVAYPQQIKEMPERSRRLKEWGIKLIPLPLRGGGYLINSDEEKKIVEELSPYRGDKVEYQLQKISPKGKLCRAGNQYAMIRVDGSVDRCSQSQTGEVGNIHSEDFQLYAQPKPCEKDYCPIESQWIVPD